MDACWWFGINNVRMSQASGHIKYQAIQPFLKGEVDFFTWPMDGSSAGANKVYARMSAGDQVAFWMGDGEAHKEWGIIGFGRICQVDYTARHCILERGLEATRPITPYPSKQPVLTEDGQFLLDLFGISYRPLRKLAARLGHKEVKSYIITVDEISPVQYQSLLRRTLSAVTSNEDAIDDLPEDVVLTEGRVARITGNTYARNAEARRRCIAEHGVNCCICGFNFGAEYGYEAEGYIHVHHLRPLAQAGGENTVDPVKDLRPVCPNCHAVIHLGGGCRTIDEIRQLRAQQGGVKNSYQGVGCREGKEH